MPVTDKVDFGGVRWNDIDWHKSIHNLPNPCPQCGVDDSDMMMAGHLSACPYYLITTDRWDSPAMREFARNEIKEALQREGRL